MTVSSDEGTVPAWFAALRGRWRLRRCVLAWSGVADDVAIAPHVEARLTGQVTLLPGSDDAACALHYEETGALRLRQGGVLQATRRYLYRCAVDGDTQALAIDFADGPSMGLPFVRLPWPALSERNADEGDDLHLCGADRYHVRYRFEMRRAREIENQEGVLTAAPDRQAVAWQRVRASAGDVTALAYDAAASASEGRLPVWDRIVQRTRVRGPKKHYAIVSILDRIDADK